MLTHISLFSGIGGIDLAAEWAGFETIAQVERDPYCQRVLGKHWPSVHRIKDIKNFPDRKYESITLISGGFPCQPVSVAGKRRGTEDDRFLWPEMFRVIQEINPVWVLAENVPGILTIEQGMVFENMLVDLENEGYETWAGLIPASGVGAPHFRYRIFVVAHGNSKNVRIQSIRQRKCEDTAVSGDDGEKKFMADTKMRGRDYSQSTESRKYKKRESSRKTGGCGCTIQQSNWWAIEPDVGRVAYGIPNRVDRLKTLGNAVVPQQVYPILQAIADVENSKI